MDTEEEYFIPLQDQSVFGAGIKRKRVNFIPATAPSTRTTATPTALEPAERYLSIVFNKAKPEALSGAYKEVESSISAQIESEHTTQPTLCAICNLPLPQTEGSLATSRPHEASIAHQVCLTHSYPPSHLDRNRPGLKYLSSYGWDPDSRLGLGPTGDGIRMPIKGKPKNDTVGLGVNLMGQGKKKGIEVKRVEKLDAGKVRKEEQRGKRKGERLREMFYQSEDVKKYLGGG